MMMMADVVEELKEFSQEIDSEANVIEKMQVDEVQHTSDNTESLESSMSINNDASKSPSTNGNGSIEKENEVGIPITQSNIVVNEVGVDGDNIEMKEKINDDSDAAGVKAKPRRLEIVGIADDLYDQSLGYLVESNLKHPEKGFLEEEEERIFGHIYDSSTVLIDVVRKLEKQEAGRITKLIKSYASPVEVPRGYFKIDGGSDIYLKYLSSEERQERAKRLRICQQVILYDPKLTSYPPHVFELYKKPFELGWKREYVMRSNTGLANKTGDVYYYPPDGGKLRSSRELATYLSKNPQHSMLVLDNFSFSKLPIGINDTTREMIRTAYDGKESLFRKGGGQNRKSTAFSAKNPAAKRQLAEGPPNLSPQVKRKSSSTSSTPNSGKIMSSDSPSNISIKSSSSRRSIQPPKRYAGLTQSQEKKQRGVKREREESFEDSSLMEMGMLPPQFEDSQLGSGKNPEYTPEVRKRGRPFSKVDPRQMNEFNFSGVNSSPSSRRSSGLNKGRKIGGGHDGGHESNYESDGMFQISAIHKNHQSMLFSAMGNLENEKAWKAKSSASSASGSAPSSQNIAEDGELLPSKTVELLPCSIRCPGMTGDVPTLQCKRCLCLYHPECLEYPSNINIPDFICSNCEDGGIKSPTKKQPQMMIQNQQKKPAIGKQLGMKPGPGIGGATNNKKPLPPKLIRCNKPTTTTAAAAKYRPPNVIPPRIPQLQQAEASRSSIHGSSNRTGLNQRSSMNDSIKRGRGRPPKGKPLISNLTITPISQQRKVKVPSVPKLNPVSVRPYSTSMGLRGIPVSQSSMQKDLNIKNSLQQPVSQTKLILPKLPGKQAQQSAIYKKFPQSVVTIGQKQFIAIPTLSSPVLSKNRISSAASVSKVVKNDNKSETAPAPALPVLAKKSIVSFTGSNNNGDFPELTDTQKVIPFPGSNSRIRVVHDSSIEKEEMKEPEGCQVTRIRIIPNEEEYIKEHPEEKELIEKINAESVIWKKNKKIDESADCRTLGTTETMEQIVLRHEKAKDEGLRSRALAKAKAQAIENEKEEEKSINDDVNVNVDENQTETNETENEVDNVQE